MPVDYVCEDMRTDLSSPSFTLSVSSSPLPLMAALCDEGMDTTFEDSLMNHASPTMPDLPLFNTQKPCLVLRNGIPQNEALSDTSGTPLSPQAAGSVKMGSPGRAEKGQAGTCQVCGETASGNFFGALVCLPCKSFFIRCTKDGGPVFLSQCQGRCNVSKKGRNRCQQCRFLKCQAAGMSRKEKPEAIEPGEGQILCRVCGDIANGIHFGVFTCEGCKKFFRRGLLEYQSYACKGRGTCTLNPRNRNNCRYCRYQKCLHVGMSRRAIKMGRPKKLNKDLEGVLLTVSQSHEINSSSTFNPRIDLDTMAGIEDNFTPSLEGTACRDEDINPVIMAMSTECNSQPNENHERFGTWKRYNSRGALPLKKGILRSMSSRDQETVVRDKWNGNGMSDEMIFIEDDDVDKSDEMYNHHCSSTSSVVKSERDSLHVDFPAGCVGSDRRKERRRRRKSESPSYFNIAADTQPGLKRWKSDMDSPASYFRYSTSDFSAKPSESNFQLNDTLPSLHSRPSNSEDKLYRAQKPVDLSLLTCFERRWKNRTYRNPVTCFSVHPLDKQQLSMRGHHYTNRPSYNHRSPVPSHASPHESESLLYNSKTTSTERKERIDGNVSSTTSQINMNTDECFSQTQRTESCSNKNITQTIAQSTIDAKGDSRPIKDDYTPKQTIDGFLISKKHLEEIDHFFLSSMSLFIDIQRRLKASCEDTEKCIQSPISEEPNLSLRNQETGSGSPEPPLSCSLGKSIDIGRLSPTGQQSTVREHISSDSSHTSGTKHSSSPSRRQMSNSRPTPSPSELTSSELGQIQEDRGLASPKGGKLSLLGHLPPHKRRTPSPIGHTPSSLGHTPSSLGHTPFRNSGNDSNELPSPDGTSLVHPGELKTSERLDTEYRFPAVRVVKYWNQVMSSGQDVQMSVQEHRVLQDMLEAYMEMLKNLDESHMDTDQHVNNLQDWPREGSSTFMEHVVRRIVRQVKEELAFMVKVPGFNDFHPDDRIFIIQNICFANVTLMGTRDWYDPGTRTFRNMMNWKLPEFHPMYTFRLNAMDLGDQITLLKMDRTEAAMLSALNVTATDISGLREPAIIEKSRDFLMSALASHLSYKGLDPEARMKELFNLMPIFRLCGFWTKSLREQIALNRQPNV